MGTSIDLVREILPELMNYLVAVFIFASLKYMPLEEIESATATHLQYFDFNFGYISLITN